MTTQSRQLNPDRLPILSVALACLLVWAPARAQVTVDWVEPTAGVAVAVDDADNVYTVNYLYALGAEMTLTKRDVNGNVLWEVSYDQTDPSKWEQATWVATDSAGNVLVTGTLKSGYSNPVDAASILMKWDPDGNLLWRQVYESDFDGSYTRKCLVDANDNVYVLGMGSGAPGYVTKVKKFAPDGTAQWSYFDADGIGAPINFKFTPDGYITISARSIFGSLNGYAKIDLDGNNVWSLAGVESLTIGDADGDSLGNTYVVHGEWVAVNAGTVLKKLDPSGALLWEYAYRPIAGFRVEVGTDDQAVVSGFPDPGSVGAAFLKVDADGVLLWENLDADGPLGLLLHALMLLDESNDAYLAAGTLFDMAVCKVNSDGSSAWTQTVDGGYAFSMALGNTDPSVFVVGGTTARLIDETEVQLSVVVDDSDPEFRGSWRSVVQPNAQNGAARFKAAGTGTRKVSWTVGSRIPAGTYDVYAWKFEHSRLHLMADNAHYRVRHATGTSEWILVDQSTPGNEWVHLGTFSFNGTSSETVLLSDEANGQVTADAVRLDLVSP